MLSKVIENITDPNKMIRNLFIVLVIAFMIYARVIILYSLKGVIWAFVLAYLLSPIVCEFEKREWPRFLAVLIIWLLILFSIIIIIALIIPIIFRQISLITQQWEIFSLESQVSRRLAQMIPLGIQDAFIDRFRNLPVLLTEQLNTVLSSNVLDELALIVVIPVLSFYMMLEREKWYLALLHIFPKKWRSNASLLGRRLNVMIGKWIRGQVLISSLVLLSTFFGLSVIGAKYALLLSTLNGILNFVPYFGAIIGIGLSVFVTFLINVKLIWPVILLLIGIQIIKSMLITPIIIGRQINQKPAAVLISLLIGWQFLGIAGFLLAVPILAFLKILISFFASLSLKKRYRNVQ